MKGATHHDAVERYLSRLRRRAAAVHLLRAVLLAAGAGGLAFVGSAVVVGPVASMGASAAAWGVVAAAVLFALAVSLRPLLSLRGARAARLLDARDPALASAARSAVELAGTSAPDAASADLVRAHRDHVHASLVQVPPARVLPWRSVRHPLVTAGVLAAAVAALIGLGVDRAASGVFAMWHPGVRSDEGVPVAAVIGDTRAKLVFPAHLGRSPVVLHDAERIEAPRGTTVHYTIRPRVAAREASLEVVDRNVRLVPDGHDRFQGRFTVRDGGALRIRVRQEETGRWLEDPIRRSIRTVEDRAPVVSLSAPSADLVVDPGTTVPIAWHATDDVGLRKAELVVATPDGQKVRRTLAQIEVGARKREAGGTSSLVAAELGARPGDRLELWVEAQDGDVVSGPNVGASVHRAVTIASESTRRLERLADMKTTLDLGLAALADRLEREVPDARSEARARFEAVHESGRAFVDALEDLGERMDRVDGAPGGPSDGSLYRSMARRNHRWLAREKRAHGRRPASARLRKRLDDRLVSELEKDDLLLADLLGRARLQDAASIAHELEALRREMSSLVAEMRRNRSPEAQRALRAALARAQARMRDLMGRLADMGENVPSDFVNADALAARQKKQTDTLAALRQALERGDLDAMDQQLAELEHQLGSLAEALGSGEEQFAASRFGPRQKAMAEAMDSLVGLEAEQRRLAGRSDEVRRKAAKQALEGVTQLDGKKAHALAEQARQARRQLEGLSGRMLGPMDDEALMRAKQRLTDSADALEGGDLGEARRMAREAVDDLEGLSRDLELSALMFSGADGHTGKAARAARRATREARQLRDDVEQAIPRVRDFLGEEARKRMQGDAARQEEAAKGAGKLAKKFEQGPDGQPLSPQAADSMRQIQQAMRDAHERLQREDPVRAAQAQEEAARRLAELRDELEKSQRSNQSGGGGGGSQGDAQGRAQTQPRVRIPGAGEQHGPMALRRKLLDAMREGAPADYAEAVRKYYEELLR